MDISEIFQVINLYVSSSTAVFIGITGLLASILGFVLIVKKLESAFSQKKIYT